MKRIEKNKGKEISTYVGLFASFLAISFIAVGLYSPVIRTNAEGYYMTRVQMTINPSISIAFDNNSNDPIVIVPSAGETFKSKRLGVTVNTTDPAGYSLTVTKGYWSASQQSVRSNENDGIITSMGEAATKEQMRANTWGLSVDDENYFYPTSAYTLRDTNDVSQDTTDVYIGVKVDENTLYGEYTYNDSGSLLSFTATTKSSSDFTLYDITALQDMTYNICSYTPTPNTTATEPSWEYYSGNDKIPHVKLVDLRDNKEYIVAKYADGKCWMTENLDYEITAGEILSRATTNRYGDSVPSLFSFTRSSITTLTDFKESDLYQNDVLVADPERSYIPQGNEKYYQGGTVASSTPTDATDGSKWEKTGVYYNYPAATLNYFNTSYIYNSVCPTGWKLPGYSDIQSLISRYSTDSDNYKVNMDITPFILSGKVVYDDVNDETKIVDAGTAGYYWTQNGTSENSKYKNYVIKITADETTYSTSYANSYDGAQIRCMYYN